MNLVGAFFVLFQAYCVSSITVQKSKATEGARASRSTSLLMEFNNLARRALMPPIEDEVSRRVAMEAFTPNRDDAVNDTIIQEDDYPLSNEEIERLENFDPTWTSGVKDWVDDIHNGNLGQMDDDTEGGHAIMWMAFGAIICAGMWVDLVALQSHRNVLSIGKAVYILAGWCVATAVFLSWIMFSFGRDGVVIWLDGYLLETMLSVDNLFVFVLIMKAFNVPATCRGKVLMIGVVAALLLRVMMFGTISLLIQWAHVITKVLGVFICWCAYKMIMMDEDDEEEVTDNACVNWIKSVFPLTDERDAEGSLFIGGKATPIFVASGALIFLDVIFAVDSVSAKTALISDLYLNYTSTGFAMFALRAKYAILESASDMFEYLKYGIAMILGLIGLKTIAPQLLYVTDLQYLFLLICILGVCIALSLIKQSMDRGKEDDLKSEDTQVTEREASK